MSEHTNERTETHACDLIERQAAIDALKEEEYPCESDYDEGYMAALDKAVWIIGKWLPSLQPESYEDTISRKAAIDAAKAHWYKPDIAGAIEQLPSAQPERVWHPVEKPPAHHKDVIVRGVEAIGNVTVHKVMQWDVDTWRPTDYAPSIMWTEWSEI